MFWKAFQNETLEDFRDAVSELIASQRSVPLFKEISDALARTKARERERRQRDNASIAYVLNPHNEQADRDFVKICMNLLRDKTLGKIGETQFEQGCGYLDQTANQLRKSRTATLATSPRGAGDFFMNRSTLNE
jgi:hypothetical protein